MMQQQTWKEEVGIVLQYIWNLCTNTKPMQWYQISPLILNVNCQFDKFYKYQFKKKLFYVLINKEKTPLLEN